MALGPGSIAFTGFNGDGTGGLAFAALTDIPAGTVIHFTNSGWNGSSFGDINSTISWTASADVAAGTIVVLDDIREPTPTSSSGTVAGNLFLDNANEVFYAYVGPLNAPEAFLGAIATDEFDFESATIAGTGLVEGLTALRLDNDDDIGAYVGPRLDQTSFADYLPHIYDRQNWISNDGSDDQSMDGEPPDVPFSMAGFTDNPNAQIVGFAPSSVAVSQPEGNSGTTLLTFTIERTGTGGNVGEISFSGIIEPGSTNAVDFGGAVPLSFSGTIADGASSTQVTVAIAGDTLGEADETFKLILNSVANSAADAVLGSTDSATGTIANDDFLPKIAFIGFNSDGEDSFSVVALNDLPAGTVIQFTDLQWNIAWTATSDVAAGTVINFDNLNGATTTNVGSFVRTGSGGGLANNNESIYAFQGPPEAPDVYLTALATDLDDEEGIFFSTGLVAGVNAIVLDSLDNDADIAAYNGPRLVATGFDDFLPLIYDLSNWITQDTGSDNSVDGIPPDAPFSATPFVVDPLLQILEFSAGSLSVSQAEGNSGTTTFTFTVERHDGSAPLGDLNFSGTFVAGTADAADFGGTLPVGFSGTILDGASSAEVTIQVSGDVAAEGNESFTLELQSGTNASANVLVGANTSAVGVILNDDPAPIIAFTGYNGDGTDNLAFAALSDIAAGTVIQFSDRSWNGSAFSTSEGTVTWTATAAISAGTIITLNDLATATPTSNLGTIVRIDSFDLGIANDIVYAYVGTPDSPITFIAAIANDTFNVVGTLDGTGLTEGLDAISLTPIDADADIAAYSGPHVGPADFAGFLPIINDPANWITQDAGGNQDADGIQPDTPFSVAGFSNDPNAQVVGFAPGSFTVSQAEGNAGTTTFTFTVERTGTGGNVGAVDFAGTIGARTTNAADFGGTLPTGFSGTIPDGASSALVTINVSADTSFEADETFFLTLQSALNASASVVLGSNVFATGTILNDDTIQIVSFAPGSTSVTHHEGDTGDTASFVFEVVRTGSGGTVGDLDFSGTFSLGGTSAADYPGGVAPIGFSGTIPAGQSSAFVTISTAGDIAIENYESFSLQLTAATNALDNTQIGSPSSATGTIGNDDTTIVNGQTVTFPLTVSNNDHLVIEAGGSLVLPSGTGITWIGTDTDVVIDNAGTLQMTNANNNIFAIQSGTGGALTFNNHAGATVQGEFSTSSVQEGTTITINNAGSWAANGATLSLQGAAQNATVVLNNLAGGTITQVSGGGSDMIRPGEGTVINNYGTISSQAGSVGGGDAIDYQGNEGGMVNNFAGGLIEGSRHAITGDNAVTVLNEAGATIAGRNGSAVNIDNDDDVDNTVHVTNYGTLLGQSGQLSDSDGDAIDTDGLAVVNNYGAIKGLGHNGYHDGEPNVSEGIAIGGGTITNHAGAEIYGYGRAIQVDNSTNGPAFAAITIYNEGLIQGDGNISTAVDPADAAAFNPVNGEAINILGTFADTLTNKGTIIGGVRTGGGDDTLTNSSSMAATGGTAVDMGDGNDTLNHSGSITGDVLMGGGNDTVNLFTGATIASVLDGGDGDDTLNLKGSGEGTVGDLEGFELVNLLEGAWTVLDEGNVIAFHDGTQTLRIDASLLADGAFAGTIIGVGVGDRINLKGIGLATAATLGAGNILTIAGGDLGGTIMLQLDPAGDFDGLAFVTRPDGVGGTDIEAVDDAFFIGDGGGAFNGTKGDDIAFGGIANDRLNGGIGDDVLDGGDGNDRLDGGLGNDFVYGGAGNDSLDGSIGNDTLYGDEGSDTLDGSTGDDVLNGGTDNDVLKGNIGDDTLNGGTGNDSLDGSTGNDVLDGGDGNDTLLGSTGNDTLDGGIGNDSLDGGVGNDLLIGGEGDDRLIGGTGSDTLSGGEGNDTLTGGVGGDVFVVGPDSGADIITDFKVNQDVIDLGALFDDFAAIQGLLSQNGANTVLAIDAGNGDVLTLNNVNLATLDANDFVF